MNHFSDIVAFYSYTAFMELTEELVTKGKTSGPEQSPSLIYFTKLNLQRLQRWEKTFHLSPATIEQLVSVPEQIWWVITEAWCGDASQTLPVMNKMTEASGGKISLRIILRDEYTDIIDKYLTNGGRSIPRLVAMSPEGKELFNWGPRPAAAQQMMMDWKADNKGISLNEKEKELHLWYARDKGVSTEEELSALLMQRGSEVR